MKNLPEGFSSHIGQQPGVDLKIFEQAHQEVSPVSLRLHPQKGIGLFSDLLPVPWNKQGRYLPERPEFVLNPLFHAGAFYVQEASSMSIVQALDAAFENNRNIRVLDLCAAPGGKSTLIAEWLNGEGLLVANEVIRSRASVLKENLDRWGYTNIIVSNNDPRQFSKLEGFFDAILVDAPCSGSGMFRKDPETQLHWSTEAVEHCSLRQKRILNEVWSSLKNDGVLIYSTCSYSEAENEAQLQEILETRQAQYLPIPALENLTGIVKSGLGYRFYPGKIQGEGFYLAMLKKVNSQQNFDSRSKPDILPIPSFLNNWLLDNETFTSVKTHLGESIFPKSQLIYLYSLLKHLHILKCGTLIGEWKGQRFFPDHELALSIQLSGKIPRLELNLEDALNYLKKESLKNPSLSSGIQLICYQGLALGWGNALPNRINNLLPKSWRIRKEIERFSD